MQFVMLLKGKCGGGLVFVVTASVMVGDARLVFREGRSHQFSFSFFLLRSKRNTNVFFSSGLTEVVMNLRLLLAASRSEKETSSINGSGLYLVSLSLWFFWGSGLRE